MYQIIVLWNGKRFCMVLTGDYKNFQPCLEASCEWKRLRNKHCRKFTMLTTNKYFQVSQVF